MKHAFVSLSILALLLSSQPGQAANPLSTRDQKSLAEARFKGEKTVTVLIATHNHHSVDLAVARVSQLPSAELRQRIVFAQLLGMGGLYASLYREQLAQEAVE